MLRAAAGVGRWRLQHGWNGTWNCDLCSDVPCGDNDSVASEDSKILAVALAVAFGLGGCVGHSQQVSAELAARVIDDGTKIEFTLGICERPLLDFIVEETSGEVRVRAITTDGKDEAACALGLTVTLKEPLGDRILVDTGSGERIAQVYNSNRFGES